MVVKQRRRVAALLSIKPARQPAAYCSALSGSADEATCAFWPPIYEMEALKEMLRKASIRLDTTVCFQFVRLHVIFFIVFVE